MQVSIRISHINWTKTQHPECQGNINGVWALEIAQVKKLDWDVVFEQGAITWIDKAVFDIVGGHFEAEN